MYTINDESKCLLLQGVPALGLESEVINLCSKFGPLESVKVAKDYPLEKEFVEVYVVKFKYFLNAVYAKKKLDDYCFMGQCLHVCYAPELETIYDTREKLAERKKMVRKKIQKLNQELFNHKPESNASTEAKQLCGITDHSQALFDNSKGSNKDTLVRQSMVYKWNETGSGHGDSNQNRGFPKSSSVESKSPSSCGSSLNHEKDLPFMPTNYTRRKSAIKWRNSKPST